MILAVVNEKEVDVHVDASVWVVVCCAECGEDVGFKVHSHIDNSLTVEVEPHQCKKETK